MGKVSVGEWKERAGRSGHGECMSGPAGGGKQKRILGVVAWPVWPSRGCSEGHTKPQMCPPRMLILLEYIEGKLRNLTS